MGIHRGSAYNTLAMNPPAIRYTETVDGFRIAFSESGAGVPLVLMPQPVTHLSLFWHSKTHRPFFEQLGQRFRLVQYDGRGTGLSDRGVAPETTLLDQAQDLEAVVNAAGLERFVVFAPNIQAHVAVRFAVEHPERVLALLLWQAIPHNHGTDAGFMAGLSEHDWERALVMCAQVFLPGEDLETAVRVVRSCATQDDSIRLARAAELSSIEDLLPQLRVPTLLLYKTMAYRRTAEWARLMVTSIPDARLVALDDDGDLYGYPRDSRKLAGAIDSFMAALDLPVVAAASSLGVTGTGMTDRSLTARERELLAFLAAGRTNREIAAELVISERTVARHVTNIYTKIGAHGKAEATAYAIRHRIAWLRG